MTHFKRLPIALAALGAATPAFAHEAGFLHTHGEGLAAAAALGLIATLGFVAARKIARR